MEERLLKLLETVNSFSALSTRLKISKDELRNLIRKLKKEDLIYESSELGKVYLLKKGVIEIKKRGFGFIKEIDGEKEYYVSTEFTHNSYDGDTVLFYTYSSFGKLENAEVVKVIERAKNTMVGEVFEKRFANRVKYFVTSTDQTLTARIFELGLNGAVSGDIVRCKLIYHRTELEAIVVDIIGNLDDPGIEIAEIAANYGFENDFPEEVITETKKIETEVSLSEIAKRRDFTREIVITIDGDDSKDFDDAVSLKKLENGNYLLGVYIADVSHYVRMGMAIDKEALKRGTSVYLADRVIPMLPHKLSNGICSLNEGVDRLVLACLMEYDKRGKLINYEITDGVIKSAHRMTYNKVNAILNKDKALTKEYSDIVNMLFEMDKLAKTLRSIREDKGGLEFEVDEYKISLDSNGKPNDFSLRVRGDAELLIEDFMLSANETVAYHLSIMKLPCVYRVHERPEQERLKNVFAMVRNLGYNVRGSQNEIHPKMIQETLAMINDDTNRAIINNMFLRSMMKAKYTIENLGHYGLAMQYYCHFTSPIRRYPDLLVHRIIRSLIIEPKNYHDDLDYFNLNLEEMAISSSKCERNAIDCEREVDDMLMAWYMEDHLYEEYSGIITSVVPFGMFVTLKNGIEGLIAIDTLDGYYTYNEQKMELSSAGIRYSVGMNVDVIVTFASKKTHKIDFMLKSDYEKHKMEW